MDEEPPILTPPETPTAQPTKPRDSATELQRLSRAIIDAHNARDFNFESTDTRELLSRISPHWKGDVDTKGPPTKSMTWDEQISAWKQRAEIHPQVHFEIKHLSSDVNERGGVAKVFMEMEVTGIGEVTLHAMNELRWRKMEGRWMLNYTLGMRGSPGNIGMS